MDKQENLWGAALTVSDNAPRPQHPNKNVWLFHCFRPAATVQNTRLHSCCRFISRIPIIQHNPIHLT